MKNYWTERIKDKEVLKRKVKQMEKLAKSDNNEAFVESLRKMLEKAIIKDVLQDKSCPTGSKGKKGTPGVKGPI